MIIEPKRVAYAFEYGDESLPHLKDLVSEKEDSEKSRIIKYLRTNCVLARPGVVYDIINPGEIIGFGDHYTDGTYWWSDVFTNYVEKYNIPVPADFREHILQNYNAQMK